MKYIFVAGAPGSKWSSVVKNIYYSTSIDNSDYSDERTYYHDASGKLELMHLGAYFDPGMEFGNNFDDLDQFSKEECEAMFDEPFSGEGIRIIKSHVFAHHINFLKKTWPDCPIIVVHRDDDACLGWWVKCGHFNISYPKYDKYYKDLRTMATIISKQNKDLLTALYHYEGAKVETNRDLATLLNLKSIPLHYAQHYAINDIKVTVI